MAVYIRRYVRLNTLKLALIDEFYTGWFQMKEVPFCAYHNNNK